MSGICITGTQKLHPHTISEVRDRITLPIKSLVSKIFEEKIIKKNLTDSDFICIVFYTHLSQFCTFSDLTFPVLFLFIFIAVEQ